MTALSTGELARQGGVNTESIRFYEREGLLAKPPRTPAGYRMFSADDARRVRFIKRAQELGFSLREIKELLALRLEAGTSCSDVRHKAEAKLKDIDQKIRDLQRMKKGSPRKSLVSTGLSRSERRIQPQIATFLGAKRSHQRLSRRA